MWCPSCGDEFREGFTHCPDCDVALVAQRPARPARRRLPPWAGNQRVEYDLSAWPAARREALDTWLFADNIPAEWASEDHLVVARPRANEVDDLIRLLDAGTDTEADTEPEAAPAPDDERP
jgi:hypothetical protein